MNEDDLLAACLAAPDDDEPRLVWADAIGGERGELVVVQCDLARHERERHLSMSDLVARRKRERELVKKLDDRIGGRAVRTRYHRGFIDRIQIDLATPFEMLPEHQLATEVAMSNFDAEQDESWTPQIPLVRKLEMIEPPLDYFDDPLERIDSFAVVAPIYDANREVPPLRALLEMSLQRLALREFKLTTADGEMLLQMPKTLVALDLTTRWTVDCNINALYEHPLEELRLSCARDWELGEIDKLAGTLRHLVLDRTSAGELYELATLKKLETFEIGFSNWTIQSQRDSLLSSIPQTVRRLRLSSSHAHELLVAMARVYGPQLEELALAQVVPAPILEQLQHLVAGEVRDGAVSPRLPPTRHGDDVFFAGPKGELIAIAPHHELRVGRGQGTNITLPTGTVARLHASIAWSDEGHPVITDRQSTNGVIANGVRVESHALVDGDTIQLGDRTLQFFTDEDRAREAARATASSGA